MSRKEYNNRDLNNTYLRLSKTINKFGSISLELIIDSYFEVPLNRKSKGQSFTSKKINYLNK